MDNFITKQEAFDYLEISSYQHLRRLVKNHNVETKSLGIGKPTLYNKTDIFGIAVNTKSTKKFAPKKPKEKQQKEKAEKQQKAKELQQKKKEVEKASSNPLNEIGQSEFLRVEQELKEKGLYMEMDRAYLLTYAIAYQNYMFYINLSKELDHTSSDMTGNIKIHPYFSVADKCFNQMEKAATKLGIGIKNRVGIEIKEETNESLMAKLLSDDNEY